jgi:hypothetical protein
MSWPREVWHLFSHEMRRSWLAVTAFVMLLVPQVGAATDQPWIDADTSLASMLLLPLAISIWLAVSVQRDGPVSRDRFWVTLPIRPSAIVASKLLVLVVLLALCACAAALALSLVSGAADPLSANGLVQTLSTVGALGAFLVLAALTRDLRGFLLGMFGLVLCAWLTNIGAKRQLPVPAVALTALHGTLLVAAIILFGRVYRTRPTGVGRRIAYGIGAAGVYLTPGLFKTASRPTMPVRAAGITFSIDNDSQPECTNRGVIVPLRTATPNFVRVSVEAPEIDVLLRSGAHLSLRAPRWYQENGVWGPLVAPRDSTRAWTMVDGDGYEASRVSPIEFVMSKEQRAAVCGNIARIDLQARALAHRATEFWRVPLDGSRNHLSRGVGLRHLEVLSAGDSLSLNLTATLLHGGGVDASALLDSLTFALTDTLTGTAIRFGFRDGSGGNSRVLMGLTRGWITRRFLQEPPEVWPRRRPNVPTQPSAEWLARSQLLVTRPVLIGSDTIQVHAVFPN